MVVSVPALLRLRDILPDSNIVGLLGPGNAELAQTLGVFNEIIILDFPDDPVQRARVMEKSAQEALIRQLAPYKFDLAIDFSRFGHSYKLLPMTGAPITLSFHKDGYKSLELVAEARSPKGEPPLRHSAWVQTLAEALALWLNSGASITRRTDLNRDDLTQYGVGPTEDYVLIHSGSRLAFIRWPHYPALAAQILSLGHKVVYIADDDYQRASLPQDALASGQLVYMARKLPSDHFDALISFASLFVGNDSGPKHLASLRGVKVVSIHPGRSDWREWGQELTGVVIGRQVPCAGCQLQYESEECVQDVACVTRITVSEVFREVQTLLSEDIS
jgi:ADP-heptose:LPS heptosyltransferase